MNPKQIKFFYCSFLFWKNLDKDVREKYLFLATSFTIPKYFTGEVFSPFVPTVSLFQDACKDFETSDFENRYQHQIHNLDKCMVLKLLENLSTKYAKDTIVFLVWESDEKPSERDTFIPWLLDIAPIDVSAFSFESYLKNQNSLEIFDI